jgi:hypothetical protein
VSAPDRKLPAGLHLNGVTGLEFGIAAALPKDGESGDCKPKIASLTGADRGVDRIVHQLPCGCGRPYLQGKAFLDEARTDYAFLIGVHQFEWLVENQNHGFTGSGDTLAFHWGREQGFGAWLWANGNMLPSFARPPGRGRLGVRELVRF